MKKRDKILEASREMFNKHGFTNVTIRMIALEMDMSSGNLNYHFKKREDILEALYFQMVKEFDQRIENLPQTEISLTQVRDDIVSSMEQMHRYKFIWTDLYYLMRNFNVLKEHFVEAYNRRLTGNFYLYQQLQKLGLMQKGLSEQELQLLAERMIHFGDTWIYCSEVYQEGTTANTIESHALKMLMILHPYFTPLGKEELQKLI